MQVSKSFVVIPAVRYCASILLLLMHNTCTFCASWDVQEAQVSYGCCILIFIIIFVQFIKLSLWKMQILSRVICIQKEIGGNHVFSEIIEVQFAKKLSYITLL